MKMVERVARAIAEADPSGAPVQWDAWDTLMRGPFVYAARAAIAAMREPTAVMVAAGETVEVPVDFNDAGLSSEVGSGTGAEMSKRLWLWKNFVDGRPEYWAFDNPFPCHDSGDPMVIGEPCGYAILKDSISSRPDFDEEAVLRAIKASERK